MKVLFTHSHGQLISIGGASPNAANKKRVMIVAPRRASTTTNAVGTICNPASIINSSSVKWVTGNRAIGLWVRNAEP